MNTWYKMRGITYQCQISNAGGWFIVSSKTFPWLLMIFQSSMTFHDFSRKFCFSRFSRPCGNPVVWTIQWSGGNTKYCHTDMRNIYICGSEGSPEMYDHKTAWETLYEKNAYWFPVWIYHFHMKPNMKSTLDCNWTLFKITRQPFWKRHSRQSLSFCLQPQRTCTWNLKLKFQSKLELRCRNHAIQKTEKSNMATRQPFRKWGHWKWIGSYPYTYVFCHWSLELIIKARLKLVRKPKNLIWPPGCHFESDITENQ